MRNIVIVVLFFTFFSCEAQPTKNFKIVPNWQKGEVKEMIVQQSGAFTVNGQETPFPTEIKEKYSIEIIDQTEKGYIVEWKILDKDKEFEELEFMKEYLSNFKYVIETDLNGNFKNLSNWKSLIELNKNLKEKIISGAKKENISQIELESITEQINLAETKIELIVMCHSLTDVFHSSYGEEISLNDTILEPTTVPNRNFKDGIPVTLETISQELDNDRISIKCTNIYDYEKLKDLYNKNFPDQEYKEQKITSYSNFIYNRQTGWFEKISFYYELEEGESKNSTIIEYIIQ